MMTQDKILRVKEDECFEKIKSTVIPDDGQFYCRPIWDGAVCWPLVVAGTVLKLACPSYVMGFDEKSLATKYCTQDGSWFFNEEFNNTWTNYTECITHPYVTAVLPFDRLRNMTLITRWLPALKRMSQVGYAVSLGTLMVAVCILSLIKKLRCPRNTLHIHLFLSFIMRAFMSLFKDVLFVDGVSLPSDIVMLNGQAAYIKEDDNWRCKVVTSLWQYFIMANYSWILMEGLYLHNLVFFALFSDNSAISVYVVLGWGLPALFVIPWIIIRAHLENTLCWTTHSNEDYFLVIRIPIVISVVLNFIFFLNIVRVLFLKIQSSLYVERRKERYRQWAKSTLVLVPLFGVHYTIFLGMSYSMGVDEKVELVWLFCDQFFASFQGFFVSLLYCLLNGEVRIEINHKWSSWKLYGMEGPWSPHSILTQSRLYFSKGRGSFNSVQSATQERLEGGTSIPSPTEYEFQEPCELKIQTFDFIMDKESSRCEEEQHRAPKVQRRQLTKYLTLSETSLSHASERMTLSPSPDPRLVEEASADSRVRKRSSGTEEELLMGHFSSCPSGGQLSDARRSSFRTFLSEEPLSKVETSGLKAKSKTFNESLL